MLSSATSASRSWRNRLIDAFGSVDLLCRRRSTVSIPQTAEDRSQQQARTRCVIRSQGTTIGNLPLKTLMSSTHRPLPPGRAAATRTFTNVRMHSAGRPDAAGNREPNPQPTPPNSDPELTGEAEASQKRLPSRWRLILSVFLPFAAGYYLSFLFRTINASISPASGIRFWARCRSRWGCSRRSISWSLRVAQIPDRGAVWIALARGGSKACCWSSRLEAPRCSATLRAFAELLVGRAMIGLGVAGRVDGRTQGHRHLVSERARRARQRLHDHAGIARGGHRDGANRVVVGTGLAGGVYLKF